MQKQYVRKMQKIGNGLGVRIPPELCQEAEVGRGDNISIEFNPDSGGFKLGKVATVNPGLADVQQQDETHQNIETESRVDNETQSQQPEISGFEFCSSCGSKNIEVAGNKYYCGDCDITYEVTPKGTIAIDTNPLGNVDKLEHRVEKLESDVDEILNNESGENEKPGFLQSLLGGGENDNDGFLQFVPVGAEEDIGTDEDEENRPDGFISW